jgi:gliding motility-associated-like protein
MFIAKTWKRNENNINIYTDYKTGLQGSFSQPLKKGQGYCIEFWVACSDIVNHAADQLGIYFHKSDQPYRKDIFGFHDFNFLELTPQVVIHTGPMMDTSGWTKIETEYIAEGGERFFILGNFQRFEETNLIKWQHNYDDEKWGVFAYIYIDDIAVYECDHIAVPEEEISPPNIITPNGDGINDAFDIYGLPPGSSLVIYNRWGNEVFRTQNYQNDWQGRTKTGAPVPDGTYFYVLTMPHGTRKAGTLTVVR